MQLKLGCHDRLIKQCLSHKTADPGAHESAHMASSSRLSIAVEPVLESLHMTHKAVGAGSLQACRQELKHAMPVGSEPPCTYVVQTRYTLSKRQWYYPQDELKVGICAGRESIYARHLGGVKEGVLEAGRFMGSCV